VPSAPGSVRGIGGKDHFEIIRRSNTQQGDVLMSMIGGNIGKALIVNSGREFSIKNVALFKTYGKPALAKYLLYYLQSGLLDIQIDLLSRGGAQGFLGLTDLRNLVFFKMHPEEMRGLVEELDSKLAPFGDLICAAESCLDLMQERRSALISAAVTGKIDVRKALEKEAA
jgi:type I restriction enzyme S subunit